MTEDTQGKSKRLCIWLSAEDFAGIDNYVKEVSGQSDATQAQTRTEILLEGWEFDQALNSPEELAELFAKYLIGMEEDEDLRVQRENAVKGVSKFLDEALSRALEGGLAEDLGTAKDRSGKTTWELVLEGLKWSINENSLRYKDMKGLAEMSLEELNELTKTKKLPTTPYKVRLFCQWVDQWNDLIASQAPKERGLMYAINAGLINEIAGGNSNSLKKVLEDPEIAALVEGIHDKHGIIRTHNLKQNGGWFQGEFRNRQEMLDIFEALILPLKPHEKLADKVKVA